MKIKLLILIFLAAHPFLLAQNTASISGKVTEENSSTGLSGATITIKEIQISIITDNTGYFVFNNLNKGVYTLIISHIGYQTSELKIDVSNSATSHIQANLVIDTRTGSELVVSASNRAEKITNAPASIRVIGVKDLDQFPGSNVGELISKIQGIEFIRSGVDQIAFNARGFNSTFNNKVFQLVDGRNSMAALSGSLPLFNNGSYIKDDIERIEIVLGPQSALYGPNAHNAVFNFITRDPRKYQGTTVAISAGNQYQFSGRFRQATKINNKWAYKISGEYAAGKEFNFYDTVYAGNQSGATAFFGPAVAIPERNLDFDFRHIRGEAHIYYSLNSKTDIILSGGGGNNNFLGITNTGRRQMRGFRSNFLQFRLINPNYFLTIYNSWANVGTSYAIASYTSDFWNRTNSTITHGPLYPNFGKLPHDSAELFAQRLGNRFKEQSQRLNADFQYNYLFKKAGLFFITGLNYQKDKPNGFGVTLVDKNEPIYVTQYGAVLQLEKFLAWNLRLISAFRYDHHSNFGGFFSPKVGLVKQINEGSFRITWGRSYAMPSIFNQYANLNNIFFGNGIGITYLPNQTKNDPANYKLTIPLQAEQVSTWEVGYKGSVVKNLYIDINLYLGKNKNFQSPAQPVGGRALSVGNIAVTHNPATAGAIQNDTLKGANFFSYFNYGLVKAYGLDIGLNYSFTPNISLTVNFSWFGSDITKNNIKNDANNDGYVSLEEKTLNAPGYNGSTALKFQNILKSKMNVQLSARAVEQYDFYSSGQIGTEAGKGKRGIVYGGINNTNNQPRYYLKNFDWGPLGGFITIDLNTGYKFSEMISANLGITNLFNTKQIESVASPSIGRLIMLELKVHIPNNKESN